MGSTEIGGGQNAIVAGWGGMGPVGPPWPNTLQVLDVVTLTNPDCRSRHTEENAYYIFDQKICAYYSHAGVCFGNLICSCSRVNLLKKIFIGDSGGALIVGNSVIGIVSWGVGDCGGGYPDVFIRVSTVYSWITQTIA